MGLFHRDTMGYPWVFFEGISMDFQGRRDDMFLLVSLNIFGSVMIQELRNHMKTNHYLFYSFFSSTYFFWRFSRKMGSKRIADGRFSRNYNGKPWNYQLKNQMFFNIGILVFFRRPCLGNRPTDGIHGCYFDVSWRVHSPIGSWFVAAMRVILKMWTCQTILTKWEHQ